MKSRQFIAFAALATAGMTLTGFAQNFANEGDLILGIRNGTAVNVLEVDLGPATAFTIAGFANFNLTNGAGYNGPSLNPNPGLAVADLVTIFGANWNTLGLNFSIAGGSGAGASGIVWVTQNPATVAGSIAAGSIGVPLNFISTETGSFLGGFDNTTAQNAPMVGGDDGSSTADVTSPANYAGAVRPSGLANDYNFFNGHPTEGVVSSSANVSFALYKYAAGASPVEEGFFTLTPSGGLTYLNEIPEPSTLSALAGGVAVLGLIRRRRAVAA
jgi:hypothetical protein